MKYGSIKKNVLVYPQLYLAEHLAQLHDETGGQVRLSYSILESDEGRRLIVDRPVAADTQQHFSENGERGILKLSNTREMAPLESDFYSNSHLFVDLDSKPKYFHGSIKVNGGLEPIDELFLIGPGLLKLQSIHSRFKAADNFDKFLDLPESRNRWLNTIRAMGEPAWRSLCKLNIVIVGAGRTGEKVFAHLTSLGCRRITMIDPDHLELDNLGEMQWLTDSDLHENKAESLVKKGRERWSGTPIDFVAIQHHCVEGLATLEALRSCDVIFSAVDNNDARKLLSIRASQSHSVLIDMATGINVNSIHDSEYRAVLVLPPDRLEDHIRLDDGSAIALNNRRVREDQRKNGRFHRSGSLALLSDMAATTAVALLQALSCGVISGSYLKQDPIF